MITLAETTFTLDSPERRLHLIRGCTCDGIGLLMAIYFSIYDSGFLKRAEKISQISDALESIIIFYDRRSLTNEQYLDRGY